MIERRALLAGAAFSAVLCGRAVAQPDAFAELEARAASLDQLHSLIVARDGRTVFARAFRGPGLGRPVNVKSVSKTLVATLTGIALDRGVLKGTDQPVAEFLRAEFPANPDPRLDRLTIDHLLTMRAGLERTSGPNYGQWVNSRNWVADALRRPFVAEPGGRMLYSTGSYHLMGAVLSRASGQSLHGLAREWLARPLGVQMPPWTRDPQGRYMGGNNMALSPEGLLRFGEMMRQGGTWDGRRIVSREWIDRSWTVKTRSPFSGDDYGYGWFITRLGRADAVYARGYGGQLLYVVPDLGVTIAITSDPARPARSGGYISQLRTLLTETVLPGLETI